MTVEESNKMIVKFMGEPLEYEYNRSSPSRKCVKRILRYHTSWDWLMPVVGKIMPLHKQFGNCNGFYYFDSIKDNLSKVNINAVYSAVTQFLTYINEKK